MVKHSEHNGRTRCGLKITDKIQIAEYGNYVTCKNCRVKALSIRSD